MLKIGPSTFLEDEDEICRKNMIHDTKDWRFKLRVF